MSTSSTSVIGGLDSLARFKFSTNSKCNYTPGWQRLKYIENLGDVQHAEALSQAP